MGGEKEGSKKFEKGGDQIRGKEGRKRGRKTGRRGSKTGNGMLEFAGEKSMITSITSALKAG